MSNEVDERSVQPGDVWEHVDGIVVTRGDRVWLTVAAGLNVW